MKTKAVLTVAAAVNLALASLAHADVPNLSAPQQAAPQQAAPQAKAPQSKIPGTVAAPSPATLSYLQPMTPKASAPAVAPTAAPAPVKAAPAAAVKPAQPAAPTAQAKPAQVHAAAAAPAPAPTPATPAEAAATPTPPVAKPAPRRIHRIAAVKPKAEPKVEPTLPGMFDLQFKGDVWKALQLLAAKRPPMTISALGSPAPLFVSLDLHNADTIEALRALDAQIGDAADLVYNQQTGDLRISYKDHAKVTVTASTAVVSDAPALMGTLSSAPAKPAPAVKPGPAVSPADEARNWQKGGAARPIMGMDGLLQYPFGQSQPTLTCEPLRACDIQLQAGEIINNVMFGDTVRWQSAPASTGSGAQAVPHVIVKPTESNLDTNLIITTNRRTYMLTLTSKEGNYVSRVGFYYPQDMVQDWNGQAEAERRKAEAEAERKVADLPIASIDQINLDSYRLRGDRSLPWYPVRVFDEGTHVWIQMPPAIRSSEAPALVLVGSNGASELVNYRVKEAQQGGAKVTYYIVDKLFAKAALIVGVGGDQQKVEITRTNKTSSGWGGLE